MIVETGASAIYYDSQGSGPPLVMIHGGLVDSRSWEQQRELAGELQLVLPDTRNFGQSSGTLDGLTMDDLAGDILAVADDVGLDSFHLLGFSIGGMIAQTVALRHPDRVRSLVLVSTRAGGFTPPPSQGGAAEVRAHVERAYSEAFRSRSAEFLEGYVAMAVENEARGWNEVRASAATAPGIDEVAGLRSPALVLHARGDGSIPLAMAEELARAIPGARLEVVENSGHTMQVERPALFNDLVLGWVKEREGEVT